MMIVVASLTAGVIALLHRDEFAAARAI